MMEHFDLVIVGAGWHGLAMAKTYLEVNSQAMIVILDYAASVGGTWASERLYPGLKTNNVVGTYEFSDFPLDLEQYGLKARQHIPGEVVHSYLNDFCQAYDLNSKIRFRTKVESATLLDNDKWEIAWTSTKDSDSSGESAQVSPNVNRSQGKIIGKRLVLATGLTSEPFMPHFPGKESFKGPVFHAKDFKRRAPELTGTKTVVVIGGNKSSWDVCYSSVTRFGAKAHMIMRRSGGGPSWCWPSQMGGYVQSISAASATRLFTWLDPNPYGISTWLIRAFIHRTWLGRKLAGLFWRYLDKKVSSFNSYDDNPGTVGFKPWISTFWMGNSLSIHNYETSWFELARKGLISAHAAEVSRLSDSAVHLSDGTVIEADAVICCTGWKAKPSVQFFPQKIADKLGFPGSKEIDPALQASVTAEILRSVPDLRKKPVKLLPHNLPPEETKVDSSRETKSATPYRLHRFILPTDPELVRVKNIAVIGAHITLHTAILSQAQALWITALFGDKLPHLNSKSPEAVDVDAIKREAYLHTEYQRIRRPKEAGGAGERYPDLVFDSIPYADLLLSDLNLRYHRKSSWFRELTEPYRMVDFRGIVQEWMQNIK